MNGERKFKIIAAGLLAALAVSLLVAAGCSVGNDKDMNEVVEGYGYTVTVMYDGMGGLWETRYETKTVKAMPNSYIPEPGVSSPSNFGYPVKARGTIIGWYTSYSEDGDGILSWDEEDKWNFLSDRVGEEDFTLYCRWGISKQISINQDNLSYSVTVNQDEEGRYLWLIPADEPISGNSDVVFSHYSLQPDGEEIDYTETEIGGTVRKVADFTKQFADGDDLDLYVVWKVNYTEVSNYEELKAAASESAFILLTSDIDMGGKTSPFASMTYSGRFNGGGHTISNCTVIASDGYYGFFGTLENAVVSDVTFENVTVNVSSKAKNGTATVGVLVGNLSVGNSVYGVELVSCNVKNGLTALVKDGWEILTCGWYGTASADPDEFGVEGEVSTQL